MQAATDLDTVKKRLYAAFNKACDVVDDSNPWSAAGKPLVASAGQTVALIAQAIIELERRPAPKPPKASP